ncbi:MAG: hypothetical protein SFU56_22305 [Capsulimonadales bacterium]|nr:hypothetical protein [Capsulimonadales bacterium]
MDTSSFSPRDPARRAQLLEFIRTTPLVFGHWRQFKSLYKATETALTAHFDEDTAERFAELAARLDTVPFQTSRPDPLLAMNGVHYLTQFALKENLAFAFHRDRRGNRIDIFAIRPNDPLATDKRGEIRPHDGTDAFLFCDPYLVTVDEAYHSDQGSITIYDVRDPAQPTKKGILRGPFTQNTVGHYPFLFSLTSGGRNRSPELVIASLADPDHPVEIHRMRNVDSASGLAVLNQGRTLMVATGGRNLSWNRLPKPPALQFYDLSDPFDPQAVGKIDIREMIGGEGHGSQVHVLVRSANGRTGYRIIDAADPRRPVEVGGLELTGNGYSTAIAVRGTTAFVSLDQHGTYMVDFSEPRQPRLIRRLPAPPTRTLQIAGEHLYVRSGNGVEVWNPEGGRIGMPPSDLTIGYMKRRARRALRNMAKVSSDRYVELATAILRRLGDREITPETHWIAFDILYGNGERWKQSSHGRGAYVMIGGRKRIRRTREERFPQAWSARPDLLRELLITRVPPAVQAFAARVLLSAGEPLPAIPAPVLAAWVESDSPLLVPFAVRRLTEQWQNGDVPSGRTAAYAYHRATPALRSALLPLPGKVTDKAWRDAFSLALFERLTFGPGPAGPATVRNVATAALLADRFPKRIGPDLVLQVAGLLMRSRRGDHSDAARRLASGATVRSLPLLNALLAVPEARREPILAGLESAFSTTAFDGPTLQQMVINERNVSIAPFGWRIIAASTTSMDAVRTIWRELLGRPTETPAVRAAMGSPSALDLLARSGISQAEIGESLRTRPFLMALLTAETFEHIVESAAPESLFTLTAAMEDEVWARLGDVWRVRLERGEGLEGFWLGLDAALRSDATGRIAARLAGDPRFIRTIARIGRERTEALLAAREPAMDEPLSRFVEALIGEFPRDSGTLLITATHLLPGVRAIGLRRVKEVGMSLPFALRLMESGLPESVAEGEAFFAAIPGHGPQALEAALALCDSPVRSVRRYGRAYVTERRAELPTNDLLTALVENPDAETQHFVVGMIAETPVTDGLERFEREVLRRRNAARKAKEAIKSRPELAEATDVETLLELARGVGTPRDAEWALTQLARRALAGERIPGFAIEGVTGA